MKYRYGRKWHVYGRTAALGVEAVTRSGAEGEAEHLVSLDVAPKRHDNVDWSAKLNVLVTQQEMPLLGALFCGLIPELRILRRHKAITLVRQTPGQVFVQAAQRGQSALTLPVGPGDSYHVGALVLTQLQAQHPHLSPELAMAALRAAARLVAPG